MDNCKICGSEMKLIPAGVSKKPPYKPYKSFMSCPNRCKSPLNNTKPQNSDEHIQLMNFVGTEFSSLNKRLDDLGRYLKGKLDNK
jgi:hypothetical protein